MTLNQVLDHCFLHFFHLDHSNAAIYCAPGVRYSPITFRLAEEITERGSPTRQSPEVLEVMDHHGRYAEDPGR